MLKTISAALLAVSVIAAPALAGTAAKTKATHVPVITAEQSKAKLFNANAKMGRHHHKHIRHHRHHKHVGMLKLKRHATPKVAIKHVAPLKRG